MSVLKYYHHQSMAQVAVDQDFCIMDAESTNLQKPCDAIM